ncbi:isochorismatase family protein family [Diplodia corticola]|uniref:Isochorismatase family protein family n=1 Tax=Diplodia corticola TaxID=236234 RepID=A0A1J9QL41_9PEZI|nr:isochorismatase family protein family [Diplodia corticola]OJD29184.1 isochorismatase family protein family [Diplodia corticola]
MASSFFADLLAQKQPQFQTHRALIAVGLQNDFCSSDGKLPVTQPPGLLDRITRLVPVFREHAGHVIWVRTELDPNKPVDDADDADAIVTGAPDETPGPEDDGGSAADLAQDDLPSASGQRRRRRATELLRRLQARAWDAELWDADATQEDELFLTRGSGRQVCAAGSRGADWADDVAGEIKPADTLITKTRYSALKDTTLLLTLRAKLITELYVCGCISNISVYATAVEAARHGIEIYLVDDCVGYRQLNRHREAIRQMKEYMGAHTISSTNLIAQLLAKAGKGDSPRARKPTADDDLGAMLKNLKLQDKDKSRSSRSSPPNQAEITNKPAPESAVSISATPLEVADVADSDDALLDETALLLERRSMRSRPRVEPQTPSRSSSSVKSKVRVRRKLSQKSQSPPEKPNSPQNQSEKVTAPPSKGGQITVACAARLAGGESNSHETLKSSTSRPRTPQSTADGAIVSQIETADSNSPRPSTTRPRRKVQSLATLPTLGPFDKIGEGDSRLVIDFLPESLRASAAPEKTFEEVVFHKLYNEVRWQKMLHNQGEVPRLVAVQGELGEDGSMPVYRHPSDQSLPLLHFSPAVLRIRKQVEELVKHPVNHVLIQLYRDGQDYISEHSDKTLDIVRGSSIVNVSFGAQRTMRLRTKRSAKSTQPDYEATTVRQTQRVPMPHNSAFVLGPQTNMRWLHGINADKRPPEEKSGLEKDFAGMRISLTFRHIGTFLSSDSSKIWGQGATSKSRDLAKPVINGDEKKTEDLIRAFGAENHATEFNWEETYGRGSDVLHSQDPPPETPTLYTSHSSVDNQAVRLYLDALGIKYSLVEPPPVRHSDDFERRNICLRDTDASNTEVCGATLILAYLKNHNVHQPQQPTRSAPSSSSPTAEPDDSSPQQQRRPSEGDGGGVVAPTRAAAAAAQTYLLHASHLHRLWAKYLCATHTAAVPQSSSSSSSSSSPPPSSANVTTTPSPPTIPPDLSRALSIDLAALEDSCASTRLRRGRTNSGGDAADKTAGLSSSVSPYLAGDAFTVADCAVWPLVDALRRSGWEGWSDERWPELGAYWGALRGAGGDVRALGGGEGEGGRGGDDGSEGRDRGDGRDGGEGRSVDLCGGGVDDSRRR